MLAPRRDSGAGRGAMNFWKPLKAQLSLAPNRFAAGLALRAVLVVSLPLAVFRAAGLPDAGLFVAIGGLQAVLVDGGGPYRDRLFNLLAGCIVVPWFYFCGTQIAGLWWGAALLMGAIAFGGALLRTLGAPGMMAALVVGATYLMGTLTAAPPLAALVHTGWVAAGSVWGLVLPLVAWRLRPYLALQRETAAALDAAARLLAAVAAGQGDPRAAERDARAVLEEADAALGAVRGQAPGGNATLSRLFALVHVASRLLVLGMELAEAGARLRRDAGLADPLEAALQAFAAAAASAGHAVAERRPWTLAAEPAAAVQRLAAAVPADAAAAPLREAAVEVLRAGIERLAEVAAASVFLAGPQAGGWLPRLALGGRLREIAHGVRAQFTLRASLFRHALRLALVAGVSMAAELYWRLPHGMWVPLTVLVVMQPDFGATRSRALARGLGTLIGAGVAGVVIVLAPGPDVWQAVVAALVFLTVLTLRMGYGLFVTFLTPLVILLLALYWPTQGWDYVIERVGETGAGIVLALVGVTLLWPDWVERRLPSEFAAAVRAGGRYLAAAFSAAADAAGLGANVLAARREAELAVANAESAYQAMLAEPRHRQAERGRYQRLTTQLGRLLRHLGALAARLETRLPPLPLLAPLGDTWAARLGAAARALEAAPPGAEGPPARPQLPDEPADVRMLVSAIGDAVAEIAAQARPGRAAREPQDAGASVRESRA